MTILFLLIQYFIVNFYLPCCTVKDLQHSSIGDVVHICLVSDFHGRFFNVRSMLTQRFPNKYYFIYLYNSIYKAVKFSEIFFYISIYTILRVLTQSKIACRKIRHEANYIKQWKHYYILYSQQNKKWTSKDVHQFCSISCFWEEN